MLIECCSCNSACQGSNDSVGDKTFICDVCGVKNSNLNKTMTTAVDFECDNCSTKLTLGANTQIICRS